MRAANPDTSTGFKSNAAEADPCRRSDGLERLAEVVEVNEEPEAVTLRTAETGHCDLASDAVCSEPTQPTRSIA
jgi:hypothetical protein